MKISGGGLWSSVSSLFSREDRPQRSLRPSKVGSVPDFRQTLKVFETFRAYLFLKFGMHPARSGILSRPERFLKPFRS
jgi:hypothetical protein